MFRQDILTHIFIHSTVNYVNLNTRRYKFILCVIKVNEFAKVKDTEEKLKGGITGTMAISHIILGSCVIDA